MTEARRGDPSLIYAGFWRRLAAFLIDAVVLLPLYWLHLQAWRTSPIAALGARLGLDVAGEAYPIQFHARWGQTIGKVLLGIRVAQLDGAPITRRQAWLRSSVEIALILVGIPTMAHVLLTWSGPEWRSLTQIDQVTLTAERDPLSGWVFALVMAWQASEFVVLLMNERRRSLHDFIAGTVVVRASPDA